MDTDITGSSGALEVQDTVSRGVARYSVNVPDEQMDRIIGAIVLPEAWLDRVLAHVHLADEVKRVSEECA